MIVDMLIQPDKHVITTRNPRITASQKNVMNTDTKMSESKAYYWLNVEMVREDWDGCVHIYLEKPCEIWMTIDNGQDESKVLYDMLEACGTQSTTDEDAVKAATAKKTPAPSRMKEKRVMRDLKPTQQAVLMCRNPLFQNFIKK